MSQTRSSSYISRQTTLTTLLSDFNSPFRNHVDRTHFQRKVPNQASQLSCHKGTWPCVLRRTDSHRRDQAGNSTSHPQRQPTSVPTILTRSTEKSPTEPQGGPRAFRIISRTGRQVQRLPRRHEGLRRDERGLHRLLAAADAFAVLPSSGRSWRGYRHRNRVYRAGIRNVRRSTKTAISTALRSSECT